MPVRPSERSGSEQGEQVHHPSRHGTELPHLGVELRARIVEGRWQQTAMLGSQERVQDNRIYLEDGRELVIQLETVQ